MRAVRDTKTSRSVFDVRCQTLPTSNLERYFTLSPPEPASALAFLLFVVDNNRPGKEALVMIGRADFIFWLRFLRRLAVGLVLVYVTCVLTLGGTETARPALYGFSSLWLMVLAVGTARRFSASGAFWRWLELAASNVAVTLVLAEFALQGWAMAMGTSLLVRADLEAYRLVPGRDYGAGLVGNGRGYPGKELAAEKKPGVLRIAALGDSFSIGPAVPYAECYLTRLVNEMPGVEIGNFGVSGAGPREYREILERDVWAARPDVVLVAVFIGNDITEALPRPHHLDPRRHSLFVLIERVWKLARARCDGSADPASSPSDRLAAPALSPRIFREVEARRLAVCLKDPASSMERKWRTACNDLLAIVASCRRHGVPLAAVLIPDEFQVNGAVLRDALAEAGLVREQLDLDGPQRRLLELFSESGVPCLDLLPAFLGVPDTYAPYDTHWNSAGNRLAAREIGRWLQRQGFKNGSD
jgi:SGNH hydrolase-like domain, acetyltransferase AlgX